MCGGMTRTWQACETRAPWKHSPRPSGGNVSRFGAMSMPCSAGPDLTSERKVVSHRTALVASIAGPLATPKRGLPLEILAMWMVHERSCSFSNMRRMTRSDRTSI